MSLGYKPSEADADVWMKRDSNTNVDPYYNCMICYADDLLHIGFNPRKYMDTLNIIYRLKERFGTPDQYIGANFYKLQLKDGRVVWSTNCVDYLKSAIENVDNPLGVDNTSINNYGDGHRPY